MGNPVDVAPTTEVLRNMAAALRKCAEEIDGYAALIEKEGDFERVSEAVSSVTSLIPNLRLDLLVVRPVRELNRRNK